MKDTSISVVCQRWRVGRVVVGTAAACVPVEVLIANAWRTNGVVLVEPAEIGFSAVPRSNGGKREFARRAIRRVRRAVEPI